MKVLYAQNPDRNRISIDEFFAKFSEFSTNRELAEQTSRILKALLRCGDPSLVAKRQDNAFTIEVDGIARTYTITFEILDEAVILTALD